MCGRVAIPASEKFSTEWFDLKSKGHEWVRNINVAPTDFVPVIAGNAPNELDYKKWSLIPWYTKADPKTGKPILKARDPKTGKTRPLSTFNARYDKLKTSSLWKPLLGKNHCTIIITGYYEWQELDETDPRTGKKKKQPWFIKQKGEDFTLAAGLWEDWVNKDTGEVVTSCTMITHDAVESMGVIHDRMPAFLTRDASKIWLDNTIPLEDRLEVIKPVEEGFLEMCKIDQVGNVEEFEHVVFH